MRRPVSSARTVATLVFVGIALAGFSFGDAGWTPKIPLGVVWAFVLAPMALVAYWVEVLAHELAHAIAAITLTPKRIEVHFPTKRARDRFAVGRLDFVFQPETEPHVRLPTEAPRMRLVLIALAGPVASAAVALVGARVAQLTVHGSAFVFWGAVILALSGLIGAVNVIPFRAAGWPGTEERSASDGLVVLSALRRRPAPEGPAPAPAPRREPAAHFSSALWDVVRSAGTIAHEFGQRYIGSEHVLAGMTTADTSTRSLLIQHGVTAHDVRAVLPRQPKLPKPPERLQVTPMLNRALERAAAARDLGRGNQIEPEHLLLTLLSDHNSLFSQALVALRIDQEALRKDVLAQLRGM